MTALVWLANVLGWPILQLGISAAILRLPSNLFTQDNWLTAPRWWEREGHLYRRWFAVRRWKSLLPDGAGWLGGFSKKHVMGRDAAYFAQFLLETRRAEIGHWCMLGCLPLFFFWNPLWARWVMVAYALAANLPCIVVQRYNRLVLSRIVSAQRLAPVRP